MSRHCRVILYVIASHCFALGVGDEVTLLVPDISYFPNDPQARQFTCRLVSEHAYWLVQDTTWFDLPSAEDEFQLIWGNIVTQESIDSISSRFEGAGVSVYDTVTDELGEIQETGNGDDRLWMVFSDIPDYYFVPGTGYIRLRNWVYTWPDDFDGDSQTGNNHDIVYVNLSPYKNQTGGQWSEVREDIHSWSTASGLGQLIRMAANPNEEKWVVRGLGAYAQYLCFGLTSALNGAIGIEGYLEDFAMAGGVELTSWWSGKPAKDFSANLGGELLWFQYVRQRSGPDAVRCIAQSELTGMEAVAHAVDPTVPLDEAVETVAYPLYEEWIITNLISPFAEDYAQGIYHYSFLDGTGYDFSIIDRPASFIGEFDEYPIPTWIAPWSYGMSAQEFASQYIDFSGSFSEHPTVHFNGMYNQNNGSGSNIDGVWSVWKVVLASDSTVLSIDSLQFDELYNGTFQLEGARTFLTLTCNNPGGTANIRYTFSQDTAQKSVWTSFQQNPMHPLMFSVYTSLLREETGMPYGYDWVGPRVELSLVNQQGIPDSTATVQMEPHAGTLWFGRTEAWSAGEYSLVSSGFDSLGRFLSDTLACAVAYSVTGNTVLEAGSADFTIADGSLPPGSVVSLAETSYPAFSCELDLLCRPVSVSAGEGLLSFESGHGCGTVYRYNEGTILEMASFRVSNSIRAFIEEPGVYLLADGSTPSVPEVPPTPRLNAPFPNPSESSFTIGFSTPGTEIVTVAVFDLCGRRVATPFHGRVQGGAYSVNCGDEFPSGIYFAVLSAGKHSEIQRMVKL